MPNVSEKFPFSILILSDVIVGVAVAAAVAIATGIAIIIGGGVVAKPLSELLRTIFCNVVLRLLGVSQN